VSAGASGAVFGLQGAVLGVLVRSRSSIPSAVLKPLVRSMLVLLAFNLLYSLGHAGIDTAAHVGGLAGGLACGLAVGASLTDKGMARRPRRDFLLAAGGFAFVLLGAARLPLAFDVLGEATALARADGTATQAYEAGLRAWRGGRLTDEGLASLVETHVLTDWAAYRRHVDGLLAGPPRVGGDRLRIVSDYLALRQRAWEQLVRALRGGDAAGIEDAIRTLQRTRAMAP